MIDRYYSKSRQGFFTSDIWAGNLPSDAVHITEERWQEITDGQLNGKIIVPGDDGYPWIVDPPPPTAEEIRRRRTSLLQQCDWTQLPDVPNEIRQKWAAYRQQLRDITLQDGFPDNVVFPSEPT